MTATNPAALLIGFPELATFLALAFFAINQFHDAFMGRGVWPRMLCPVQDDMSLRKISQSIPANENRRRSFGVILVKQAVGQEPFWLVAPEQFVILFSLAAVIAPDQQAASGRPRFAHETKTDLISWALWAQDIKDSLRHGSVASEIRSAVGPVDPWRLFWCRSARRCRQYPDVPSGCLPQSGKGNRPL